MREKRNIGVAIFETLFSTLCFLNLSGIAGFYIRVNTVARTDEPVEVWPESELLKPNPNAPSPSGVFIPSTLPTPAPGAWANVTTASRDTRSINQ